MRFKALKYKALKINFFSKLFFRPKKMSLTINRKNDIENGINPD